MAVVAVELVVGYLKLLEFEPMRDLPLDHIDGAVIERFKFWALRKVGRTTVNRYLATLRKGLRYAWRKFLYCGAVEPPEALSLSANEFL